MMLMEKASVWVQNQKNHEAWGVAGNSHKDDLM